MQTPGRNPILFVAMAAVVVAALATSLTFLSPGTVTTTTTSGPPSSASEASVDGLTLTLSLGHTGIHPGESVTINVTEANTSNTPLNISVGTNWPLQGLRMGACYSSVYPFGVAVYRGHYTKENVSEAKPLSLYPIVPCPLMLRYVSGYYFQPNSEQANVLPGSTSPIPMTSGLVASGNYTSGSFRTVFTPGQYTVAAGDEWGTLILLHFVVLKN